MNLLNLLTRKNLQLNKKRTIVTIIGIILSVALIMAVSTMYNSLISSLINFEKNKVGNFHVQYKDVDEKGLDEIKQNRKIEDVYITEDVGYAKIDSKNEYKPYAFIKKFNSESLSNLAINLVSGRLPKNENEIVIPTHLKTNGRVNYKIGDTITLNIGKRVSNNEELDQYNTYEKDQEEIIDAKEHTYKIVGIINRPSKAVEYMTSPGYTFITYLDKIDNKIDVYTKYTKEGVKEATKVTAAIIGMEEKHLDKLITGNFDSEEESEKLFKEYNDARYRFDQNQYLMQLETDPLRVSGVNNIGFVVAIVCIIILVTSVFCIKNSFDISITEKIKQYGMLRSIGATKKQIRQNVFYEATTLGIIAIPLGLLLGILASYILIIVSNIFLTNMMTDNLNLVFGISIYPFIVSIVLGLITIYLSALRSAFKASKVSPIESIRNSANIKIKAKKLKTPKIIDKVFGIGGSISYKNIKRNKKKYKTTVISIIVSVSIFIALSSFMSLAFRAVDNEVARTEYNISLNLDYDKDKVEKIEKFDYINQITVAKETQGYTLKDELINIHTLGDREYKNYVQSLNLNYDDVKDKIIFVDTYVDTKEENGKIVKTKKTRFDFKENDTIALKIENEIKNIKIAKITEKNPFGFKLISSEKIIMSDELFDQITVHTPYTRIYIDSDNPDKLQDNIDEYLKETNYVLSNSNESVNNMNNLFTLVAIFLYGFIIVITLIGITNIYNTITTNMELRKMEFANLKSLGMTNYEFNRMIRLESLFIGLKSLIFGVPIGCGLSYLIYNFLGKEEGLAYELPILSILISIVAVFILIHILMKYSIKKINKQNIIETIRNENI